MKYSDNAILTIADSDTPLILDINPRFFLTSSFNVAYNFFDILTPPFILYYYCATIISLCGNYVKKVYKYLQ